jgi:hypothetical protein
LGTLHHHDFGLSKEAVVSKKRLAAILGKSTRWLELRVRDDGMPSVMVNGRRMFRVSEVEPWVEKYEKKLRTAKPSSAERIADLENRVADLERRLVEIERRDEPPPAAEPPAA